MYLFVARILIVNCGLAFVAELGLYPRITHVGAETTAPADRHGNCRNSPPMKPDARLSVAVIMVQAGPAHSAIPDGPRPVPHQSGEDTMTPAETNQPDIADKDL